MGGSHNTVTHARVCLGDSASSAGERATGDVARWSRWFTWHGASGMARNRLLTLTLVAFKE